MPFILLFIVTKTNASFSICMHNYTGPIDNTKKRFIQTSLFVDDNNNRWSCIAVTCLNLRHHLNRELTCLIRTINRPRTFHVFVPQWKGMVNKWSCSMTVPPTHPVTCHKGQLCHEDHSIVSWHPPPTSSTNQKKGCVTTTNKKVLYNRSTQCCTILCNTLRISFWTASILTVSVKNKKKEKNLNNTDYTCKWTYAKQKTKIISLFTQMDGNHWGGCRVSERSLYSHLLTHS